MSIGENIKATRTDHDEKQESLAKELEISTRQLQRYEQDKQEMGIYKLKALCEYYQVSADYILGLPYGLSWPRIEKERR